MTNYVACVGFYINNERRHLLYGRSSDKVEEYRRQNYENDAIYVFLNFFLCIGVFMYVCVVITHETDWKFYVTYVSVHGKR